VVTGGVVVTLVTDRVAERHVVRTAVGVIVTVAFCQRHTTPLILVSHFIYTFSLLLYALSTGGHTTSGAVRPSVCPFRSDP